MPRQPSYVPPAFTIAGAPLKTKRKGIRHSGTRASEILDQLDMPKTTQHRPRQRSVVVQRCPRCREYFTEADRGLGRCHRDGAPYRPPA